MTTTVKKSFIALSLLILSAVLSADAPSGGEVRLSVSAPEVAAGRAFELNLTNATGGDFPQLKNLPEKLALHGSSQRSESRVVNGAVSRSATRSYTVSFDEPGEYTIGPLKVSLGRRTVLTNSVKVKVLASEKITVPVSGKDGTGESAALGSLIFGKAELTAPRNIYYVGEQIALTLKVYTDVRSDFRLSYPVIDAGKALFADYSRSNPENPAFAPVTINSAGNDKQDFNVYNFKTMFRALAPGKLAITAVENAEMLIDDGRGFSSRSFFFGDFGRRERFRVRFAIPAITIRPLPEPPPQSGFTGLVGDWRISAALKDRRARQGEAVNLSIAIKGVGALDNLHAPELDLTGFRVYPPEVNKYPGDSQEEPSEAKIDYVLIPLRAAENLPVKLALASFDPQSGEYRVQNFEFPLQVVPAAIAPGAGVQADSVPAAAPSSQNLPPPAVRTRLLGWKQFQGRGVALPFPPYRWGYWSAFLLAPLAWGIAELVRKIRLRHAADSSYIRRRRAAGQRRELLKKLRNCRIEQLPELVNGSVVSWFADYWDMPPGITAAELSRRAEFDRTAAGALRSMGELGYAPSAVDSDTLEKWRGELLRAVKLLTLTLGASFMFCVAAPAEARAAEFAPEHLWSESVAAAEAGDYAHAAQLLHELERQSSDRRTAELFYNQGCAAEQEGKMELALYCFEQARLLDPLDYEIQENLNILRRRFFVRGEGEIDNPRELAEFVLSRLRPDQYSWLLLLVWSEVWLLLIFRRRMSRGMTWTIALTGAAAMALLAAGLLYELHGPYRSGRGMIIVPRATVYRLPNDAMGDGEIAGGSTVEVLEKQGDFQRIRDDRRDAWVKTRDVRLLLPPGGGAD